MKMNINVTKRSFTYNHPIQGTLEMNFVNDKEVDRQNFNLAILGSSKPLVADTEGKDKIVY